MFIIKLLILRGILILLSLATFTAIQCFECGSLSILPRDENDTLDRHGCSNLSGVPHAEIDTCSYDIDVRHSSDTLQMQFGLSQYEYPEPVCYILKGMFRGGSLIMRGCDALPMPVIHADDYYESSCLQLDSSFKVWFVTEAGKELITNHFLCACNDDFCNIYDEYSEAPKRRSEPVFISFILLSFIISYKYIF